MSNEVQHSYKVQKHKHEESPVALFGNSAFTSFITHFNIRLSSARLDSNKTWVV